MQNLFLHIQIAKDFKEIPFQNPYQHTFAQEPNLLVLEVDNHSGSYLQQSILQIFKDSNKKVIVFTVHSEGSLTSLMPLLIKIADTIENILLIQLGNHPLLKRMMSHFFSDETLQDVFQKKEVIDSFQEFFKKNQKK